MDAQSKTKVVGAFVVGIATVAGAYIISSFSQPTLSVPTADVAAVSAAPGRVAIPVVDTNLDGVEDWRETFVIPSQTIKKEKTVPSGEPKTLTEQFAVNFFQDIIRAEGQQGIGRSKEKVIEDTVTDLANVAKDKIVDYKDIKIGNDDSAQAIRTYANAHADIILMHENKGARYELEVLDELLRTNNPEAALELGLIADTYKYILEDTKRLEVPPRLAKGHLDIINVYQALYFDIKSMQDVLVEPAVALVRIQRYKDDAKGLNLAFQNLYKAIVPYASVFGRNDSALLFTNFGTNN